MIAIIDYGAGNLQSVVKAFTHLGADARIVRTAEGLAAAQAAVLPGVGSFGAAMTALEGCGLVRPVLQFIASGKPFLGVCLGLQLLFEQSEEAPGVRGLGVYKGTIRRFPALPGLKVPHMGWNSLVLSPGAALFADLPREPYVYFVHSYYLDAEDAGLVAARADYGLRFDAAIHCGNVHGVQFHPEKSGAAGLQIIKNFLSLLE